MFLVVSSKEEEDALIGMRLIGDCVSGALRRCEVLRASLLCVK